MSSLVDLRIKNYFKDYLFRDIRALATERDEKGARRSDYGPTNTDPNEVEYVGR